MLVSQIEHCGQNWCCECQAARLGVQDCEATAKLAARLLGCVAERWVPGAAAAAAGSQVTRASLVDDLRRVPGGGHEALSAVLPTGIAFHHSGAPEEFCLLGAQQGLLFVSAGVSPALCW